MRITSQNEMIDVNYDMCTLRASCSIDGSCDIWAETIAGECYLFGTFPSKTAAIQELTRIWESWQRGCSNHQIRKAESYEL